jgi:hypothetical protein
MPAETGTLRAVRLAQHAGATRLAANLGVHQILNRATEPARVLIFATSAVPKVAEQVENQQLVVITGDGLRLLSLTAPMPTTRDRSAMSDSHALFVQLPAPPAHSQATDWYPFSEHVSRNAGESCPGWGLPARPSKQDRATVSAQTSDSPVAQPTPPPAPIGVSVRSGSLALPRKGERVLARSWLIAPPGSADPGRRRDGLHSSRAIVATSPELTSETATIGWPDRSGSAAASAPRP